jgi:hypothetical protein
VVQLGGQDEGTTTLTWDAGKNHPNAEVRVQVEDRDERLLEKSQKGTRQVRVKAGKSYLYTLVDSGEQLDSVTVKGKRGRGRNND